MMPTNMFCVSTSWNFKQHQNAEGIVNEIRELGIENIELNFSLSSKLVEEFVLLKNKGMANIVSLHNYCPVPDGIDPSKASPDNPCLSSIIEEERLEAVANTKKTIDYANRLNAKAVVLHMGRVNIKGRTISLGRAGKESSLYGEIKAKMVEERKENSRPYFEMAIRSLEELEPYADKMGISLGVENRYYFREIPSIDEMCHILDHFGGSRIYYWHDAGHAQMHENLGLAEHEDYLKKLTGRLLGVHLHDISGIQDHKVPGDGKFDFKKLIPYIKKDTLKVIEAHQPATSDDLKRGIKFLTEIFKQTKE